MSLTFKVDGRNHILLIEFTYNNSYQAIIGVDPYEASYGRHCRSPMCWVEPEDSLMIGPELMRQITEEVTLTRDRILAV